MRLFIFLTQRPGSIKHAKNLIDCISFDPISKHIYIEKMDEVGFDQVMQSYFLLDTCFSKIISNDIYSINLIFDLLDIYS